MNRIITRGFANNSSIITQGFSYYNINVIITPTAFSLISSLSYNRSNLNINANPLVFNLSIEAQSKVVINVLSEILELDSSLFSELQIITNTKIIADILNGKFSFNGIYPAAYDEYFAKKNLIGKLYVNDYSKIYIQNIHNKNSLILQNKDKKYSKSYIFIYLKKD